MSPWPNSEKKNRKNWNLLPITENAMKIANLYTCTWLPL